MPTTPSSLLKKSTICFTFWPLLTPFDLHHPLNNKHLSVHWDQPHGKNETPRFYLPWNIMFTRHSHNYSLHLAIAIRLNVPKNITLFDKFDLSWFSTSVSSNWSHISLRLKHCFSTKRWNSSYVQKYNSKLSTLNITSHKLLTLKGKYSQPIF